ncbi:MAG: hydroxymethylbilane synthase [Terriglobia bacterium]|jgi:hydroxymethylbilane synthase
MRYVIGSRGSKLALWQAHWVRDRLAAAGHEIAIRIIKTTGDKLQAVAPQEPPPAPIAQTIAEVGSKGLFIKEIEEALLAREIDVAVHSLKDLPAEQPAGLVLGAVPQREDARDVFIARDGKPLASLPDGVRVATSSLRRQTQLRSLRPDLAYVAMRGNLDTRLRKLERGECEALVLAAAGVHRLGLGERITAYFSFDQMCPAVGQGALGMEIRADDGRVREAVAPLDHPATHQAVRAERALLRRLGGGCQAPIAAHALLDEGQLRLRGLVANLDATQVIRAQAVGSASDPEALGAAVAEDLLRKGAQEILDSLGRA